MAKKIKLFFTIFLILIILHYLSLIFAYGIGNIGQITKLINDLAEVIFKIFSYPLYVIDKIFHLELKDGFWFSYAILINTLFYTIIIYKLYLWNKNRKKVKEE